MEVSFIRSLTRANVALYWWCVYTIHQFLNHLLRKDKKLFFSEFCLYSYFLSNDGKNIFCLEMQSWSDKMKLPLYKSKRRVLIKRHGVGHIQCFQLFYLTTDHEHDFDIITSMTFFHDMPQPEPCPIMTYPRVKYPKCYV